MLTDQERTELEDNLNTIKLEFYRAAIKFLPWYLVLLIGVFGFHFYWGCL